MARLQKPVTAKHRKWLMSHAHPPDSTLSTLTLLTLGGEGQSVTVETTLVLSTGSPYVVRCEDMFGMEDEEECLVCMSEVKNVVLLPCRHVAVCDGCLKEFQQHKCPVCRAALDDYCVFSKGEGKEVKQKTRKVEEEKEVCKED